MSNSTVCGYDALRAPFGPVWIAVTERGVARVTLGLASEAAFREDLERLGAGPLRRGGPALDRAGRQLREYFEGRRRRFDLPLDLSGVTPFRRRVLEATAAIPYGGVATYGEVARAIGRPGAARAVGQALGANPVPILVPCHRVVASSGRLGGFSVPGRRGGAGLKRRLLEMEGVAAPPP